jgi:hypothetical protein
MEFQELLKNLANKLEKLRIKYCVTGGWAVSVWGRPRGTFDIDIVIQLGEKDIDPLIKNLHSLSKAGYIEESLVREKVEKGGEFNFIHSESGIKIDFWAIKESDEAGMAELKRRIGKKFNGQKIYFISPDDLILSKLRWYKESESERHLEDARSVIKISKSQIDFAYLKKSAKKQSVDDILNNIQ